MNLDQALNRALEAKKRLQRERAVLDARLADTDVEIRGLRLAMERDERPATDLRLRSLRAEDMARTDAIVQVLQEAGQPLSPGDVVERLHAMGRDDEYNPVSAALVHLAKSDRVHSVGRGQWIVGPDPNALPPETGKSNRGPDVTVRRANGEVVVGQVKSPSSQTRGPR